MPVSSDGYVQRRSSGTRLQWTPVRILAAALLGVGLIATVISLVIWAMS
jgi:hypothetical protein